MSFIDTFRKLARCNVNVGHLIQAILNDEINAYGDTQIIAISQLQFSKKQIYEYAKKRRQIERGGDFYIKDAFTKLGFKTTQPIPFLIRKGIIKAKKRDGDCYSKWLITEEMIQSFLAKYILSAKLAEELGTSGVFLSKFLMLKGVLPISGPSVDGGKQYIFLKSDLESINLNKIIPIVKLENKRKRKKVVLIDSKSAAEILEIDVRTLAKIVRNGVLDSSSSGQNGPQSGQFFNLFTVERLKKKVSNYDQLVSISVAAKMLDEDHGQFLVNWIQPRYLKVIACNSNKRYLRIKDVKALIKLRERTFTTVEAAKYLGVATNTILRFVRAGRLKVIKKAGDSGPRNLYWRHDVERLRGAI